MNEISYQQRNYGWKTIVELILSILAFLGFSGLALLYFAIGLLNQVNQGDSSGETTSALSLAWGFVLIAIILAVLSLLTTFRIAGHHRSAWMTSFLSHLNKSLPFVILLWPLVLLLGYWVNGEDQLRWIFLPLLHVLAVSIPVLWLVYMGIHGLKTESLHRSFAAFCTGMVGSTALALIFEGVLLVILAVAGIIIISSNPSASFEMNLLVQRLSTVQNDQNSILEILKPFLLNPVVIFIILALFSGFIPLIEELLKPLAVWFLGDKLHTPADGFVVGLLAGGGFTLIESLGRVGNTTAQEWLTVEIGRGGTDLLHILTAGMMGWALVYAWQYKKLWLPILVYLGAVLLHGLWNGLSLCLGFLPLYNLSTTGLSLSPSLSTFAAAGLGILIVIMMVILLRQNQLLRVKNIERISHANYPVSD